MEIVYLLLPLALVLVIVAILAFIWSVRDGQLDDLSTPAMRVLFDDEVEEKEN